ncbi:hypothetical protein Rsub_01308 [Raphidocelis subcapitata]|uniref:Uncharacterized protein n=1 Tax=Raphidocelis subcapitata TaxID=307507 RepID=A0A2V0NSS8_9CHLO|nr:hypothetical protein Rsub_01308 [Raphidocelis subcapitata]|eukprot:GBF88593.1 hypothetical protein Rsub_01308 [Raphidocelis subcapitata]
MKLAKISAFARPEEHLTKKTLHGAIVTLMGVLLASTLFCHELSWYLSPKAHSKMEVDLRRHRDLGINVDVTFHAVPCAALSVDIIDASGTADSDVNYARGVHLRKVRLDAQGRPLQGAGDYRTPQSQRLVDAGGSTVVNVDLGEAMRHMGEMEQEMGSHEGCRLSGDVTVRRVAGRMHFAVHQQSFVDMLPQMLTGHVLPRLRNMSHTIHRCSFGPSFPGQVNPLDGTVRVEPEGGNGHAYKYYIKIVPSQFTSRMGAVLESNSYSVSEYALPLLQQGQAGHGKRDAFVDLVYDLSPIVMRIRQSPLGLLHFLVRLCAVVGGAVSVTRLCDGLVHGTARALGLVDGGARSSSGSGSHASDGILPMRSSNAGSHRSSHGGARASFGGLASSLLRYSSGGGAAARYGGSMAMSPLTGFAPPTLTGFGSWSTIDGENAAKKV